MIGGRIICASANHLMPYDGQRKTFSCTTFHPLGRSEIKQIATTKLERQPRFCPNFSNKNLYTLSSNPKKQITYEKEAQKLTVTFSVQYTNKSSLILQTERQDAPLISNGSAIST